MKRRYYPVFFDLEGRLAVVIGDGVEAVLRANALLEAGARVRVVGARPHDRLRELGDRIELLARAFVRKDLEGATIAIACGDASANGAARDAATALHVPLNVVDVPPLCDWIHGAVLRRGALVFAISTSGAAPALAVRIKERLAAEYGAEYGRFLDLAAEERDAIGQRGLSFAARRRVWYRIADSEALDALRIGDVRRARAAFARELAAELVDTRTVGE